MKHDLSQPINKTTETNLSKYLDVIDSGVDTDLLYSTSRYRQLTTTDDR